MRSVIVDRKYRFMTVFDPDTGFCVRTGIIDGCGKDTGKDPFMASFPHLIDVGVMGSCAHGRAGLCEKAGVGCYQSGLTKTEPNMKVDDFRRIAEECRGRCMQLALGGRGDPDMHENFGELLRISRENLLVPNFTTSGIAMTDEKARLCAELCGAVAVSWYRSGSTTKAIETLLKAGVKTNVHYVLGNNTIDEALDRLENGGFPDGINAVVFLLHKPAGLGRKENVLSPEDPRVRRFFELLDGGVKPGYKIGTDSCTVPGITVFCRNVNPASVDACEGGRFSCYVGPDMVMVPCSFDQDGRYAVSLADGTTIEEAWNSETFEKFRGILRDSCPDCPKRENCMGGCPLMPETTLCADKERRISI